MAEKLTHLIGLHSRNKFPFLEFTPSEGDAYLNLRRGEIDRTARLADAVVADIDTKDRVIGIGLFNLRDNPVHTRALPVSTSLMRTLEFVFIQSGIPPKAG